MRAWIPALLVLAACEPFPDQADKDNEGKEAFEYWRNLIVAGRMSEAVQMTSSSLRSQWIYDRLTEGDHLAMEWRVRLQGNPRTDLDLWMTQAASDRSRGRVSTLPGSVLSDPAFVPVLINYMKEAQGDLVRDFRELRTLNASIDENGVSVLTRNRRGDPEIYAMVLEGGVWKVDGHRIKK